MSRKFRLQQVIIEGYYFVDHQGLFWHSGKFWHGDKEVKIVYNNGSKSINFNGIKFGLKKLRTKAIKCKINIEINKCPF